MGFILMAGLIFLLAIGAFFLLAIVFGVIIFRIKRLPIWARIAIVIAVLPVSIYLFLSVFTFDGFVTWFDQISTSYAFGVTAQEANKNCYPKLPLEATDINYFNSSGAYLRWYDCKMSEAVFLVWTKQQNWKPVRFITNGKGETRWADEKPPFPKFGALGTSYFNDGQRSIMLPFTVEAFSAKLYTQYWRNNYSGPPYQIRVKNGYYFDDYDTEKFDDVGSTVIYDTDTGHLYLR